MDLIIFNVLQENQMENCGLNYLNIFRLSFTLFMITFNKWLRQDLKYPQTCPQSFQLLPIGQN